MYSKIIDGKKIAKKIFNKIKKRVNEIILSGKRPPGLSVISIGNNSSSKLYIKKKKNACEKAGFFYQECNFKTSSQESEILKTIEKMNKNNKIDGILIQLPIPKNINTKKIIEKIEPKKDVDGFHPYNIGCLCTKSPKLRPCTPRGIIKIIKKYKIKTHGLNALIIGASNIVGRPMMLELLLLGCTTTITHRFTKNLKDHLKIADIIIIAIGKPNYLKGKYIKSGAIIIDVGINKIKKENKLIGDVDFNSVYPKVSYITPVPGGVGPMTVVTLLKNTLEAYENKYKY